MTVLYDDLCARYEFYLHIISFFIKGFQFPLQALPYYGKLIVKYHTWCSQGPKVTLRMPKNLLLITRHTGYRRISSKIKNSGRNAVLSSSPFLNLCFSARSVAHYIWLLIFRENECVMLSIKSGKYNAKSVPRFLPKHKHEKLPLPVVRLSQ